MAKQQRIIFVLERTHQGRLKINMSFYPKLSKSKEDFEKLPMYVREMQNTASKIGDFVMKAMAKHYKEDLKD